MPSNSQLKGQARNHLIKESSREDTKEVRFSDTKAHSAPKERVQMFGGSVAYLCEWGHSHHQQERQGLWQSEVKFGLKAPDALSTETSYELDLISQR